MGNIRRVLYLVSFVIFLKISEGQWRPFDSSLFNGDSDSLNEEHGFISKGKLYKRSSDDLPWLVDLRTFINNEKYGFKEEHRRQACIARLRSEGLYFIHNLKVCNEIGKCCRCQNQWNSTAACCGEELCMAIGIGRPENPKTTTSSPTHNEMQTTPAGGIDPNGPYDRCFCYLGHNHYGECISFWCVDCCLCTESDLPCCGQAVCAKYGISVKKHN